MIIHVSLLFLRGVGYKGWISIEDRMNGLEKIRASAEFLRGMMFVH
jgi:sugar phosphate isomerase/epimerase